MASDRLIGGPIRTIRGVAIPGHPPVIRALAGGYVTVCLMNCNIISSNSNESARVIY